MDGISSAGTMQLALQGTSELAVQVLASTEHFSAKIASELFASLGIGTAIDIRA
jgi:hypothetical protein